MPKITKVKEPVGVIMRRPLPTDPGDYLLFITRQAGGPFSQAGTAIFAVDGKQAHPTDTHAFLSSYGDIVFNKDVPFLLIPRVLCQPVTVKELAKIQTDEKHEWDKAYKHLNSESDGPPPAPVADIVHGNYI